MKIPIIYKLIVDDFKKKDIDLANFQKVLQNFRISKKDWLTIAKDLNGFGLVEFEGKYQHRKIRLKV